MKRLAAAALAALMLTGCANDDRSGSSHGLTKQSATEIEITQSSETPTDSSSKSRIIYRERIYNISSYTKSDLFIEDNGRIWCGFYMHNEGQIDRYNRLCKDNDNAVEDYQLDDDVWLAAYLSDTKDDDFMLFGETFDFNSLSGEKLSALCDSIAAVDTSSACDVSTIDNVSDTVNEYVFTDLIIDGEICRSYVNTQGFVSAIQDKNANAAMELVHDLPEYKQWRELCVKNLLPYSSQ